MKKRKLHFLLGALFLANCLIWVVLLNKGQDFLVVNFLALPEGEAILIELPGDTQVLIDGGENRNVLEKLNTKMPFYDRKIELIIFTHPHEDHLGGLIEVLRHYEVEQILETSVLDESSFYKTWHGLVKEKGIPVKTARRGELIKYGNRDLIRILYPLQVMEGIEMKNLNNSSVVAKLFYGGKRFLFVGDLEKEGEMDLIKSGEILTADVLKIGHHGAKTSSTKEFLGKVNPAIAVIEVSPDNEFGHPHSEVLERLKNLDIKVFRTDLEGDIEMMTDGESLRVKKEK